MFNQYVLILVWIGLMALFQGNSYREEFNELTGEWDWRVKPLFAFIVMAPVIWMAANRGWVMDTYIYIPTYQGMPDRWSEFIPYLFTITKDKGFYGMSAIIRIIFGRDYFLYLLIIALIQGISVSLFFRKFTVHYVYAIFLFIASTDYISWMFNGIRQFMAVVIVISATTLMLNEYGNYRIKKMIPVVITILLASTMHQSALLMLPILYIAQGEAWNKKTFLFMGVVLLAIAYVGRFTNILNDVLSSTQYANVVSDYQSWSDDGTNPIRVLVYSVPAIISFFGRRKIKECGDGLVNFCVNMSILSSGMYLVSMVTSGVFLGRLPIYCSLFGYILLPWELDNIIDVELRQIVKMGSVIGYLAFYYYQMHLTWGMI